MLRRSAVKDRPVVFHQLSPIRRVKKNLQTKMGDTPSQNGDLNQEQPQEVDPNVVNATDPETNQLNGGPINQNNVQEETTQQQRLANEQEERNENDERNDQVGDLPIDAKEREKRERAESVASFVFPTRYRRHSASDEGPSTSTSTHIPFIPHEAFATYRRRQGNPTGMTHTTQEPERRPNSTDSSASERQRQQDDMMREMKEALTLATAQLAASNATAPKEPPKSGSDIVAHYGLLVSEQEAQRISQQQILGEFQKMRVNMERLDKLELNKTVSAMPTVASAPVSMSTSFQATNNLSTSGNPILSSSAPGITPNTVVNSIRQTIPTAIAPIVPMGLQTTPQRQISFMVPGQLGYSMQAPQEQTAVNPLLLGGGVQVDNNVGQFQSLPNATQPLASLYTHQPTPAQIHQNQSSSNFQPSNSYVYLGQPNTSNAHVRFRQHRIPTRCIFNGTGNEIFENFVLDGEEYCRSEGGEFLFLDFFPCFLGGTARELYVHMRLVHGQNLTNKMVYDALVERYSSKRAVIGARKTAYSEMRQGNMNIWEFSQRMDIAFSSRRGYPVTADQAHEFDLDVMDDFLKKLNPPDRVKVENMIAAIDNVTWVKLLDRIRQNSGIMKALGSETSASGSSAGGLYALQHTNSNPVLFTAAPVSKPSVGEQQCSSYNAVKTQIQDSISALRPITQEQLCTWVKTLKDPDIVRLMSTCTRGYLGESIASIALDVMAQFPNVFSKAMIDNERAAVSVRSMNLDAQRGSGNFRRSNQNQSNPTSPYRGRGGSNTGFSRGRGTYSNRGRGGYTSGNNGCFKCGEQGHFSRDCPNNGTNNQGTYNGNSQTFHNSTITPTVAPTVQPQPATSFAGATGANAEPLGTTPAFLSQYRPFGAPNATMPPPAIPPPNTFGAPPPPRPPGPGPTDTMYRPRLSGVGKPVFATILDKNKPIAKSTDIYIAPLIPEVDLDNSESDENGLFASLYNDECTSPIENVTHNFEMAKITPIVSPNWQPRSVFDNKITPTIEPQGTVADVSLMESPTVPEPLVTDPITVPTTVPVAVPATAPVNVSDTVPTSAPESENDNVLYVDSVDAQIHNLLSNRTLQQQIVSADQLLTQSHSDAILKIEAMEVAVIALCADTKEPVYQIAVLLDSGSVLCVMQRTAYLRTGRKLSDLKKCDHSALTGFGGNIEILGMIEMCFQLQGKEFSQAVHVVNDDIRLPQLVLGLDWLQTHDVQIDFAKNTALFYGRTVSIGRSDAQCLSRLLQSGTLWGIGQTTTTAQTHTFLRKCKQFCTMIQCGAALLWNRCTGFLSKRK